VTHLIVAISFLVYLAAIYCGWRAIVSARTPQGSVGWVVFLAAMPVLAVPLYAVFGHHKIRAYMASRRASARAVAALRRAAARHIPHPQSAMDPKPFERLAGLPAVGGNAARLLIDGDAAFAALYDAMATARHDILAQFYILRDDPAGRHFHEALTGAARRGVKVRLLVDAIGSHGLPERYFAGLRDAGVDVVDNRQGPGPKHRTGINFRNHRKVVVIDGRTGFVGGLNVGEEYMGRDPQFGHWRDTFLRLDGPVVEQLQLMYCEDWHWARGETVLATLDWQAEEAGDVAAMILPAGPADAMDTGALFFFSAIVAARRRVWISSPYCVPDIDLLSALKQAAMAGRDVRLLVPDRIDHRIPWLAAFAYFDELRAAGVQIWRYTDGFLHQKAVLIDDDFAAIGSANFDNRSFRLNFEVMALLFDRRLAGEVSQMLEADFANAYLLDRDLAAQPWHIRYGAPVARLFAPVL